MKTCYRCDKELNLTEIVAGTEKYEKSPHAEQIDDFVHCCGKSSASIQEEDTELINRLKEILGEGKYVGRVMCCVDCVEED